MAVLRSLFFKLKGSVAFAHSTDLSRELSKAAVVFGRMWCGGVPSLPGSSES